MFFYDKTRGICEGTSAGRGICRALEVWEDDDVAARIQVGVIEFGIGCMENLCLALPHDAHARSGF